MNKHNKSTFDRLMSDPRRKKAFEKGYEKFLVSEFLIEAMKERDISVRKLSSETGVSPTLIQNLRSGKAGNISINSLASILNALGYRLSVERIHNNG